MIPVNVNCPKCGFSFAVLAEGPGADIGTRCPKCGSAVFGTAHDSRKVIGAKAKYGILDLFVYRRHDGRYALCMMNANEKTGWPEESHEDLQRAKDALANYAVHAIVPEDFGHKEKPRLEDLKNWRDLYEGELPEACLHLRAGRES